MPETVMLEDEYKVAVYKYDLSHGKVKEVTQALSSNGQGAMVQQVIRAAIGNGQTTIEGIWHTGLVVYEKEYFFGGGIQKESPGTTMFGTEYEVISMGTTSKTESEFNEFLAEITLRFTQAHYSLLSHNCNTFTDECVGFLTGEHLPDDIITGLPENVINAIKPFLEGSLSDIESRFNALSSTSDQSGASQQPAEEQSAGIFG
eukprot:411943_1